MTEVRLDRRIKKTKKSIYKAVAKLLTEKDINRITVKEICELADINRKTFYNYYSGIYNVIDEIEDNLTEVFCRSIDSLEFEAVIKEPYLVFDRINQIISEDPEFYSHLLMRKTNSNLIKKAEAALKATTKKKLESSLSIDSDKLDVILDFAYAGMLNTYHNWFNSEYSANMESLSKTVGTMCFGGLNAVIEAYSKAK